MSAFHFRVRVVHLAAFCNNCVETIWSTIASRTADKTYCSSVGRPPIKKIGSIILNCSRSEFHAFAISCPSVCSIKPSRYHGDRILQEKGNLDCSRRAVDGSSLESLQLPWPFTRLRAFQLNHYVTISWLLCFASNMVSDPLNIICIML